MRFRIKIYIVIVIVLCFYGIVRADKIVSPPPFPDTETALQHYIQSLWENLHRLEVVTTDPNSSRTGMKGDMLHLQENSLDYFRLNNDGAKTWNGILNAQDNEAINLGAGPDASITFDGDSLNIKSNIKTSTDDLEVTADDFAITATTVFVPSTTKDIVAGTGITSIANTIIHIAGSGGAVDITADPQIEAGTDGQYLIIQGTSDTNTVKLENGTGLHMHGGDYTMTNHDNIVFKYDASDSEWQEVSRNAPSSEKAWAFRSRAGASGTTYAGGFYFHSGAANDFSGGPTFGTANSSYAAHFFIVTGAQTVDVLTLTVTGTSINDEATRTTSDTENIVIPNSTAAGTYYETDKKWLGQVTITVASGTAKTCDFGFSKYWDNNNTDFRVLGLESTWLGGATDTAPNIILRHHIGGAGNTDWTYTGSGATPPTPLAAMATDHTTTEDNVINGENGAWKRVDLNTMVEGSVSEGTIIEIVTTSNKTFELGNFLLRIRPD